MADKLVLKRARNIDATRRSSDEMESLEEQVAELINETN
jgi:hypothetical protein